MKHTEIENAYSLLTTFHDLLQHMNDINCVIGGTCALAMHGLNIGREIDDLDIIVYTPTQHQKSILSTLETLDTTEYYGRHKRSIKSYKNEKCINFIIEHVPVPRFLTMCEHNDNKMKIQSVENVINAKLSYMKDNNKYVRLKDIKDCINLKNLNFNY